MSAEALAWFCTHLVEVRRAAAEHGLRDEVEAMVGAARAKDALDMAEVRDLFRRLGGPDPGARSFGPPAWGLPGVDPGEPARVQYRCPTGRCSRIGTRPPGGAHPQCHLDGEHLTVEVVGS